MIKTYKKLLKESSLSRIRSQINKHDSGIITAFRDREDCGRGDEIQRSEKMKRNAELKRELIKSGYGVTSVNGAWIENGEMKKENSFIVVDIVDSGKLKNDLIRLGKKYEQDAVIFIKNGGDVILIGTNKCPESYPGNGNVDKLGKAKFGKNSEIMTKIRGRPFIFE